VYIKYLLATPPKMDHDPLGVVTPQVENHWFKRYLKSSLYPARMSF